MTTLTQDDIRKLAHEAGAAHSEGLTYFEQSDLQRFANLIAAHKADTPPQRKPLTDDVLVPLEILEAAASSLDSFCGNLGWGDADLQNMDNLFGLISQHKAAHNIKEQP